MVVVRADYDGALHAAVNPSTHVGGGNVLYDEFRREAGFFAFFSLLAQTLYPFWVVNLDYGNPYWADSTQQVELGCACLGREQNHGKGAPFFGLGQPGLKACGLASLVG